MAEQPQLLRRKVHKVVPTKSNGLLVEVLMDGTKFSEHILEERHFANFAAWSQVRAWAIERGTLDSGPECMPAREVASLLGLKVCGCGDPKCDDAFHGYPNKIGSTEKNGRNLLESTVAIEGYIALRSTTGDKGK